MATKCSRIYYGNKNKNEGLFQMLNDDLCFVSATELAKLIQLKKISVQQLIRAHLDQIERLNPTLNAIVTLTAESAMEQAVIADQKIAANEFIFNSRRENDLWISCLSRFCT